MTTKGSNTLKTIEELEAALTIAEERILELQGAGDEMFAFLANLNHIVDANKMVAQPEPVAYRMAAQLAQSLFDKHHAHHEAYASKRVVWELLDTTEGVLSQIENMVCQLVQPEQPAQPEQVPVAVLRYQRGTTGRENEMPQVVSCNWLVDGDYQVFSEPPPKRQPLTDEMTDRCIEAADTRWADAFVPIQWARHFKNAIEAAHGIKGAT